MESTNSVNRQRRRTKSRKGAAAAELAVCLPVIVLLVFASIEACSMTFLRQALSATCYEGIRLAIQEDVSNQDVLNLCNEILDGRKVNGATITIDPPDITAVSKGSPITITITAPCDENSVAPSWFFGGRSLSGTASMVNEGA